MTAQAKEHIIYKGESMQMAAEPLNIYLMTRKDIDFAVSRTDCWRGYFGSWEVKNKKLYLTKLSASINSTPDDNTLVTYKKVDLSYLFPGQKEVFANWFTGNIRIPNGELLAYYYMGYESLYEYDIFLQLEAGVVISEKLVNNKAAFEESKNN